MSAAMSLQAQQRALQAAICAAGPGAALLRNPVEPGLSVYRQAYSARLSAALRDNYAVLWRAMGDADFDALALAYLRARPSRRASIRWFGDRLAEFMAGAYAGRLAHPALVDFARMDWALRGAFDDAEAPLLTAAQLAAVAPQDWPALVLRLQPSVRLQALDWSIEPAWRVLRAHDPDAGEAGEAAPALPAPAPLAHLLLVWRAGLETRWRALEPPEAALLQALAAGHCFAALCELAAGQQGAAAAAAGVVQALQRWLAEGLLGPVHTTAMGRVGPRKAADKAQTAAGSGTR